MSVACIIPTRDMAVRRDVEDALFIAMDQARESRVQCEYKPLNERYGVALGRNRAVASFLQSDYSHLLFVDDDVVVPPNTINDLLECDSDIAAGCYVMLHPINRRATPVLTVFDGEQWATEWFDGVRDVEQAATGCMLICRDVFAKVGTPGEWFRWPSWLDDGGVLQHRSDDVEFCRQARDRGFKIRAHGNVRCGHLRLIDLGCLLPGRVPQTETIDA